MENFFSFLERHIDTNRSLLCVGIDPHTADLPAPTAQAALEFSLKMVKETAPYAAAFKPNAAFFEAFGPDGWAALKHVIDAIKAESDRIGSVIPVILDAKRGDIASTADAYAASAFESLGAHAITLSPYLGADSIAPFIANRERGAFVLCKTSNPGAGLVQDLALADGALLHEKIAQLARSWNTQNNVGLVVGATQPESLARVRAIAPELWILAPGVGAQGGDLEKALMAGLRTDGMGVLVPVSRAISRAANMRNAARDLRDEMNEIRARRKTADGRPSSVSGLPSASQQLATSLLQTGCVKFGQFKLKSGLISPIYMDLRQLVSHPKTLAQVAAAYAPLLDGLTFDRLAALPYAALPIGTAISLRAGLPMIYPRKEAKAYGTKADIEGAFAEGETALVIDDLTTTGDSKFEAIDKLTAVGLKVTDVVVLIDRQSGAKEAMAARGVRLHAVVTLAQLLDEYERANLVPAGQIAAARQFLKETGK